jgi:hypothetical protein
MKVMKGLHVALLVAVFSAPLPASAGELVLAFTDGRVTIKATDVPLRQVLSEWARLGRTRIVGMEKLGGGLVTLQLVDVPEKRALEVLLRQVAGYVVAARAAVIAGTSRFDRIALLPTSVASAAPVAGPARPAAFAPPPQPTLFVDPIQLANEQSDAPEPAVPPAVPVFSPNGEPMNPGVVPGNLPPQFAPGQNPLRPYQTPADPNAPAQAPPPSPSGPLTADRPGVIPVPLPPAPRP